MENQTLEILINWADFKVVFKNVYTRKIDKEYNRIVFNGMKLSSNKEDFQIDQGNFQDANDYLVKEMTNLNERQIEELSVKDYNTILGIVQGIKNPLNGKKDLSNNSEKPSEQTAESVKSTEIIS